MKVNQVKISNYSADLQKTKSANKINFKGIGSSIANANKWAMNHLEKGGFFAEFVLLDMIGLVLPRVYQGFQRNKEELGHLNYQAGTEEFLREFITGPSLFLIPIGAVILAGKALGKGVQINSNVMNKFKTIFKSTAKDLGKKIIDSDLINSQKHFASKLFDNLFKEHPKLKDIIKEGDDVLASYKKRFTNILEKSISQNSKSDLKKSATEFSDVIADINTTYFNGKKNTHSIDIVFDNKTYQTSATDLFEDARKYMQDIIPSTKLSLNELADKSAESIKSNVNNIIDQLTEYREKGRRLLCVGGTAALAAFLSIIPKIYQRSKTNPALNGLLNESSKENKKC